MADNTTLDPGAGGDVVATDDVGGSHYQRVKLTDGTADSSQVIASGGGAESAALRVTVASDSTGVLSVDDNGGSLTVDNAALSVTGGGVEASALRVTVASDSTGVLSVDDNGGALSVDDNGGSLTVDVGTALPAGTNNIGDVDILSIAAGTNTIGDVGVKPRTSGGLTIGPASGAKQISAASTNATSVKASAGQLFGWYIYNDGASEVYFKIYDKASAPTVGTDVPDLVLAIPASSAANAFSEIGIAFGTGIATAITTAAADADTGSVAANQVVSNLFYA
jgi:hypothetical protein